MSNGQGDGNTLYDSGIGWAILLVVFAALVWLFWFFFEHEVRDIVRWIRYSQMWVINFFVDKDYTVVFQGKEIPFRAYYKGVPDYEKGRMTYEHLSLFSALAMQPLKKPIVFILGAGALWCMFLGPRTHYRTRLDLEGLIHRQSEIFPVISPFIEFNPSKQPPRPPGAPVPADLPPFAEALGPEEWLAYNDIAIPDGKIDEAEAAQAFRKQLGPPWRGAQRLEPYKKILLAAFCLKAARKRDRADEFLGRLSMCWSGKSGLALHKDKKLVREANAVLRDKKLAGKTLSAANRHAYETTAMLRALQYAREEGGVLAPAQFVWMRAYNRRLWYPLNNLGRQSFHTEALGAMAHFKIEKMTQRPVPVPKVEDAVKTLQEYMESTIARPIPQLDYSKSKKRGVKKAI